MALTIGNIIFIIIMAIAGAGIGIWVHAFDYRKAAYAIWVCTVIMTIGLLYACNWYNTTTASGIRGYKDYQSEMSNGMNREITITAEDGDVIFHYKGKCDIERGEDRSIKFEAEDGTRYIINYGERDTLVVKELK